MDTLSRLRALTKRAQSILKALPADIEDKTSISKALKFAVQKVTKDRDIMPHADTLLQLRNRKAQKQKRTRSRKVGKARVPSYQHVNEGLQKLIDEEAERQRRQLAAKPKKKNCRRKTYFAEYSHDTMEG